MQSRLDYFLMSSDIFSLFRKFEIGFGYRTDHSMISLGIVLDKCHLKRFNYWKFNNSFLKKSEVVNLIKEKVNEVSLQYLNVDCLDGK